MDWPAVGSPLNTFIFTFFTLRVAHHLITLIKNQQLEDDTRPNHGLRQTKLAYRFLPQMLHSPRSHPGQYAPPQATEHFEGIDITHPDIIYRHPAEVFF